MVMATETKVLHVRNATKQVSHSIFSCKECFERKIFVLLNEMLQLHFSCITKGACFKLLSSVFNKDLISLTLSLLLWQWYCKNASLRK